MLRSSIAALFIILFVSNNPTKATESEDFINNLFILELESKIANVVVEQSLKHVISKDLASAIILDKSAREILDDAIKISDTSIQDILLDSAIVEEMAANRTLDSAAKIEKIKNLVMQSGFDIFSMGVNAYGIGQNIGALWNGDGSWIENTAGLSSNVLSLALTSTSLASRIPSSAWASSWAKIGFADILTNSAAYKNVNTILLYGQIYSWLYSYMRNNEIDTIKTNLIKAQKTVQFDRKLQMDKLVNILRLKIQTTPLSTLGRGEIIDVLEDYLILTDDRFDSDLILWERFLARSNNATYLLNEFGVDNFDSLSSIERMHIALDSLSEMAVREDLRFIDNLQDSVNNGFNFSDILAGAFQGSSAYKILNVEDLKATMMPCYESASSDCSTYEYYKYFFRNEFNSALASMCIDRLAVVGQIIEALQKDIKVSQALQLLTGDTVNKTLVDTNGDQKIGLEDAIKYIQINQSSVGTTKISENIVVDHETNYYWQDMPENATELKSLPEANLYCQDLTLGGLSWKIPNRTELFSIVDRETSKIKAGFENVELSNYWTIDAGKTITESGNVGGISWMSWFRNTYYQWVVNFINGSIDEVAMRKFYQGYESGMNSDTYYRNRYRCVCTNGN